jgi:hypothetical protein
MKFSRKAAKSMKFSRKAAKSIQYSRKAAKSKKFKSNTENWQLKTANFIQT